MALPNAAILPSNVLLFTTNVLLLYIYIPAPLPES